MKTLFDTTEISGMKMKNRIFRSATHDGRADEKGHTTEKLLKLYENLAKGGVGSIITGLTNVTDAEKLVSGQMGIYDDSFIEEYKRLTDIIHSYNTNIIVQLVCNGAQNKSTADGELWAPSEVADLVYKTAPKEMTIEDIYKMEDAFAKGAARAKEAGFDGVQIHVAHGYLLSRFLTPYYNRRTDEYGGSIENRARAVLETIQRVRAEVGEEYPVFIKINCEDFMENGLDFEDCMSVCKMLKDIGITAVEVSGGIPSARENEGTIRKITPESESYFKHYASRIAEEIEIPVILVGGNRDYNRIEDILNQTQIDFISLCRPFIREPELINRWISGDKAPAKCISCSKCFGSETRCIFNN